MKDWVQPFAPGTGGWPAGHQIGSLVEIASAAAWEREIELIRERLQRRAGHFMNPVLIQSQFDTLEEPDGVLQINAELPADEIVRIIRARVSL